ncbi:hypothetical protein Tco_1525841 [Tanacetum coccineum]
MDLANSIPHSVQNSWDQYSHGQISDEWGITYTEVSRPYEGGRRWVSNIGITERRYQRFPRATLHTRERPSRGVRASGPHPSRLLPGPREPESVHHPPPDYRLNPMRRSSEDDDDDLEEDLSTDRP